MKFDVTIQQIRTVHELKGYWSQTDFYHLLEQFDFPDADKVSAEDLREMLYMAIADFEPHEAVAKLLAYKLSDQLTEGQIEQLSHEMMNERLAEEYSDLSLHADLFHINQLLHQAYNGKFPNIKASVVELSVVPQKGGGKVLDKETILRAISGGLTGKSLIMRLFDESLASPAPFAEAEHILWEMHSLGGDLYKVITSDYWLNEEDFEATEFSVNTPEED